jgi:hypothetical protein
MLVDLKISRIILGNIFLLIFLQKQLKFLSQFFFENKLKYFNDAASILLSVGFSNMLTEKIRFDRSKYLNAMLIHGVTFQTFSEMNSNEEKIDLLFSFFSLR